MFYDIFLELCTKNNISPSYAGEQIGVNKSTVSHWKNKGLSPNQQTLIKIADYFNVSMDYLSGKEKSEEKEKAPQELLAELVMQMSEEDAIQFLPIVRRIVNQG